MLPFAPIASLLIELNVCAHLWTASPMPAAASRPARPISSAISSACSSPTPRIWGCPGWRRLAASRMTCCAGRRSGTCGPRRCARPTWSTGRRQLPPVGGGKSMTALDMTVHGGQVLSSCTHVSDQHSTFGTKTSHRSPRGAFRAGRLSEQRHRPPPFEHLSDTNGVMLTNCGLFELVGKLLSPAPATWARSRRSGTRRPRRRSSATRMQGRFERELERRPHHRMLAGSAAHGRVAEMRAGHRLAGGGQVIGRLPAEHPGGRAEGVGHAAPHPARAAPGPALRPAGCRHLAGPGRSGVVSDRVDNAVITWTAE